MHRGFIKLHRKMLQWEWIACPETLALFVHLLLNANFEDKKWRGIEVKRGQIIAGRASLSEKTGLSQRSVRTSLERLKSTNEVTIKTTNKYSIITITNWDLYQSNDQQNASKRPTSDQQTTTPKECKERKELKEEYISENFENFWKVYPRKIGKAKAKEKYILAEKKMPHEEIMISVMKFSQSVKNTESQFIPHPATWLFQERYFDEINLNENRKGNANERIKQPRDKALDDSVTRILQEYEQRDEEARTHSAFDTPMLRYTE